MAERNVTVRLSAKVDQYVAAMNEARKATSGLSDQSSANLQKLGGQMTSVGKTMTASVTLPIVGAGAAAIKMSGDYDRAFSQMVGLAGVPASEVDRLKEAVLDLSGETARSPIELAEALYAAASSGLDSAQAMDAVTIAARGASAGLGATQDIVGLVASATAAYGTANIDAAKATDILTATIREGRADPAELAGTLGRVLPIAAQLGVSFDEVGGAVAYLSNVFGDTNRTVTATNGLMVKLVSPTQQGRDALKEMGTSLEELHAAIDENGLMGALDLLREKGFAQNELALRALFDDMEAYSGAVSLLNADQAQLTGIMDATANSTGALQGAVAAIDPDVQAMRQAWVDLQRALIEVGAVVGPIIAGLARHVSGLAGWFTDLDPTLQQIVIGFAALAAAGGPLLIIAGTLIRNLREINAAMKVAGGSAITTAGALAGVTAVLVAAGAVYHAYTSDKRRAKQATDEFVAALEAERDGHRGAVNEMIAGKLASEDFKRLMDGLGISATDMARYIRGESVPALDELAGRLGGEASSTLLGMTGKLDDLEGVTGLTGDRMGELVAELDLLRGSFAAGSEQAEILEVLQGELAAAADLNAASIGRASHAERDYVGWLRERGKAVDEATAAEAAAELEASQRRNAALTSAQSDYEQFLRERARAGDKATAATNAERVAEERLSEEREAAIELLNEQVDAINGVVDAYFAAADANYALHDAEDDFAAMLAEVDTKLAENEDGLRGVRQIMDDAALSAAALAQSHLRVADETAKMNGETLNAKERVDLMNDSLLQSAASASGPARQAIVDYIAQVNGIPAEKASEILALIDQGKIDEAETKLAEVSRTRESAVEVFADTATAEADIARLVARRTVNVDVKLTARALDSGGFGLPGDLVAERRPEFVNGRLVTSPTRLAAPSWVTGGAETAQLLAGDLGPAPARADNPSMSTTSVSVEVHTLAVNDEARRVIRREIEYVLESSR